MKLALHVDARGTMRVSVRIENFARSAARDLDLVVDTGATRTIISGSLALRLGLEAAGHTQTRAYDGRVTTSQLRSARVALAFVGPNGRPSPFELELPVAVVASIAEDAGLLGLDVLTELRLAFDGPKRSAHLSTARPPPRRAR